MRGHICFERDVHHSQGIDVKQYGPGSL